MWKILTVKIREEIYFSLTNRRLFPEEQKGCRKGSRGTGELLYSTSSTKARQDKTEKSGYGLVNYKKAYDMVPQNWIINCLKISDEVVNFMEKTMKN